MYCIFQSERIAQCFDCVPHAHTNLTFCVLSFPMMTHSDNTGDPRRSRVRKHQVKGSVSIPPNLLFIFKDRTKVCGLPNKIGKYGSNFTFCSIVLFHDMCMETAHLSHSEQVSLNSFHLPLSHVTTFSSHSSGAKRKTT